MKDHELDGETKYYEPAKSNRTRNPVKGMGRLNISIDTGINSSGTSGVKLEPISTVSRHDSTDKLGCDSYQSNSAQAWHHSERDDLPPLAQAQYDNEPSSAASSREDATYQTNGMANAPWHNYSPNMPIAYSYLKTDDILQGKLSGQLVEQVLSSQYISSASDDGSDLISTWSSSHEGPTKPRATAFGSQRSDKPIPKTEYTALQRTNHSTGNYSFPQPSHDLQSNSEAPKQGIFPTLSDRADQGETYATRPPLKSSGSAGSASFFSDFASGSHNNQFGPGVRAKISTVLPSLIETIPISSYATIFLTEYGCMHSRAVHMFKGMIECFVARVRAKLEKDPSFHENQRLEARRASRTGYAEETADWVSFVIIHEDSEQSDLRSFQHMLDSHPESYLDPLWQSSRNPSLQNAIFSMSVMRPFGSRIVPPDTLHLGFSLMDLHWTHAPTNNVSIASMAHAELTMSLSARAKEFRRGGIYVMAYIARSESVAAEEASGQSAVAASHTRRSLESPAAMSGKDASRLAAADTASVEPRPKNIWNTMSDMIVPCLQRLVSCGMMKVDVARHMLTLPMYPRTKKQTLRVLEKFTDVWSLDWSCGLGKSDLKEIVTDSGKVVTLQSEPNPLHLPQPAWLALKAGKITRESYNDHVLQMFKNVYEGHFRMVLQERGQLSKGATEFILDSLWDVLRSRMDEPENCQLANSELEVQLMALRRL